ncbi:MAG: hypothetical protein ACO1N0_15930 [Fluviicola sp.]
MASKRVKITFATVNDGNYSVIKKSDIAETNQRVKEAMKDVVRTYEKKETQSQQQAALLVLNA